MAIFIQYRTINRWILKFSYRARHFNKLKLLIEWSSCHENQATPSDPAGMFSNKNAVVDEYHYSDLITHVPCSVKENSVYKIQ